MLRFLTACATGILLVVFAVCFAEIAFTDSTGIRLAFASLGLLVATISIPTAIVLWVRIEDTKRNEQ